MAGTHICTSQESIRDLFRKQQSCFGEGSGTHIFCKRMECPSSAGPYGNGESQPAEHGQAQHQRPDRVGPQFWTHPGLRLPSTPAVLRCHGALPQTWSQSEEVISWIQQVSVGSSGDGGEVVSRGRRDRSQRQGPTRTKVWTPLGRARAWLRLALMQKRLADYLRLLITRKDLLSDFYENSAVMVEEEGAVIVGLLVGLNVIDANLCVKGEDLDTQVGVIDFSMYLKNDIDDYRSEERNGQIAAILDQKNYVEELNRQLNSSVHGLQGRVDNLEKSNSKLIEELAIAKNNIIKLQEENHQLRNENTIILMKAQQQLEVTQVDVDVELDTYKKSRQGLDEMYNEARKQLREECQLRQDVENELVVQVSMKQEMDLAMKLLEKDIHEKQDTLIGLRHQLDEVKAINVEMYSKMQTSDDGMKQKNDMITRLEEKTNQITATMKQLEQRLQEVDRDRWTAEDGTRKFKQDFVNKADSLQKQIAQREKQRLQLETDLKIEKEWQQTLQNNLERERDIVAQLSAEAQQINGLKKEFHRLQDENSQLTGICDEQEQALEELGCKLSESKLKIEDIKEANKALQGGQIWLKDKDANICKLCEKEFSISRRKHHCRNCGEIFCNACSDNELPLPASPKPVRVCDTCHALLLQRCSSNAT
uniref:RUN and FYVE domain-containing protein 2 n=1 Tax=Oncorhynchus tshawytscha TaxID=74940 RepID=A0A8C8HL01_ONCTS